MNLRKYRPIRVILCLCFIWVIYVTFSKINWKQWIVESMGQLVKTNVLPVECTLENKDMRELSFVEKILGDLVPMYGYAVTNNQERVIVNMIDYGLEMYNANEDKEAIRGLSDGSGALQDGLSGKDVAMNENNEPSKVVSGNPMEAIMKINATGTVYNRADLYQNDFLRSHFYTITSITSLDDNMLRGEEFLNKDMSVSHDASSPQILIFHTHSQENFADSIEGDANTSIVGVGDYLTKLLTEKYGYNVIHDTSVYDYVDGTLDRSKAYTYAEEGVQAILDANPSIDVVIDLHRDGVADTTHLVTEFDGKQMSKIMFFNGVSYSNNVGDIGYLYNPNRDDNLAMSLQMQLLGEAYYPGFLRSIYINAYRYCLHMRGKSMLIEAGAQTNTVQEEMNAMEPLSDMLDKLLRGEKAY